MAKTTVQNQIVDDIVAVLEAPDKACSGLSNQFYDWSDGESAKFANPKVNALIRLYQSINSKRDRQFLVKFLLRAFKSTSANQSVKLSSEDRSLEDSVDDVYIFFIKVGMVDVSLSFFENRQVFNEALSKVLLATRCVMFFEPQCFSKKMLDTLKRHIERVLQEEKNNQQYYSAKTARMLGALAGRRFIPSPHTDLTLPPVPSIDAVTWPCPDMDVSRQYANEVLQRIKIQRFQLLESRLDGFNLEINQDKVKLQSKIKEYGFPPELAQCLDKIDEDFQTEDGFDLKSCIGHIRTIVEKVTMNVAERILDRTGVNPSEPLEGMGKVRNYLKDKRVNFLNDKQDRFLDGLFALASDEGAHAVVSDVRHARVLRNVAIEGMFYLMGLLDDYSVKHKVVKAK